MTMTTKPCDAMRGPSQATADFELVYPGAIEIAPNVPALVSVG